MRELTGVENTIATVRLDGVTWHEKKCMRCQKQFLSKRIDKLTCSSACQMAVQRLTRKGAKLRPVAVGTIKNHIDFGKYEGQNGYSFQDLEKPGELGGFNSTEHQWLIRNMIINLNYQFFESGLPYYALSEIPIKAITSYRIPDIVIFNKFDKPETVIELYGKNKSATIKKVADSLEGKVKHFYCYIISNDTLMKISNGKEKELGEVKVGNKTFDFNGIKTNPEDVLPKTWKEIKELKESQKRMEGRFDKLEGRFDKLENMIKKLIEK
jgi:hypothetical protein